jgi:hypothetical protein
VREEMAHPGCDHCPQVRDSAAEVGVASPPLSGDRASW